MLQQSTPIDWTVVDRIAATLGVSYRARQKWKQRATVPHRWRLPLIQATGGVISADDFVALDRRRERASRTTA